MKIVSVVVLNWNRWSQTVNCVKSLEQIKSSDFKLQIIVVDNGSKEGPPKKLTTHRSPLTIIRESANLGFAGGNNIGIKHALSNNSDYIFLLNNDTTVDKNIVRELLAQALQSSAGIIGPKIYFTPGMEFHQNRYQQQEKGRVFWYAGGLIDWKNLYGYHRGVDEVDHGQYDKVCPVDYASGAAMFLSKEVIQNIGLLDERYFMYYEDLDYCLRAKQAGYTILYKPTAVMWHDNAGSSRSGSSLQDYYITRNRLLFGLKYASLKTKLYLFAESLKLLLSGRPPQKKGVADFLLNRFGGRYLS